MEASRHPRGGDSSLGNGKAVGEKGRMGESRVNPVYISQLKEARPGGWMDLGRLIGGLVAPSSCLFRVRPAPIYCLLVRRMWLSSLKVCQRSIMCLFEDIGIFQRFFKPNKVRWYGKGVDSC